MKLTIDMSKEVGSKVKSFEVENCDNDENEQGPLSKKKSYYNLLAPDYLTDGGDDYDMLKIFDVVQSSDKELNEVLVEYIKSFNGAITKDNIPEDRITILDELVFELTHIVLEQNRSSETNFGDLITDAMKLVSFKDNNDIFYLSPYF